MTIKLSIIATFLLAVPTCNPPENHDTDRRLEEGFLKKINSDKAEYFEYLYDELVPQKSYFVDGKLKYLTFRHGPENGFVEGRVTFDPLMDSIAHYTLREVLPGENGGSKLKDSLFVFLPARGITETYYGDKLVDKSQRSANKQLMFIYKMKIATQNAYDQRKK